MKQRNDFSSASTARPQGLPDVGDYSAWPGLQSDFQPSHGEPIGSGNHAGGNIASACSTVVSA
jgi:hypothetical protein